MAELSCQKMWTFEFLKLNSWLLFTFLLSVGGNRRQKGIYAMLSHRGAFDTREP